MNFDAAQYIWNMLFGRATLASFLKKHFGKMPDRYPNTRVVFPRFRHPCIAVALSHYAKADGVSMKLIGTATEANNIDLSDLMHPDIRDGQLEGPVNSTDIELANGKHMSYVSHGLYLLKTPQGKLALWTTAAGQYDERVAIEVISKDRKVGAKFIDDLRRLTDQHSIYRGKILSLKNEPGMGPQATFQNMRKVDKSQLVLPNAVLNEIDAHTSLFSKHHQRLKDSQMHLKRGVLLYGPPGSGKTSTTMYIVNNMPERTTIFVGAEHARTLSIACEMARSLQPSTIIIDDVDLIAGDRKSANNDNETLSTLLNQMDGIADDSDVLFLLTTNSPETLEPALAARPGRIDQAICVPLPDAECRRRLLELYSQSMNVDLKDQQKFVDATEGASGALIKELFRKALVLPAERDESAIIDDEILEASLTRIRTSSPMMEKLLAYTPQEKQTLELAV